MKNRHRSKPMLENKEMTAKKTDAEEKLYAAVQWLRNNPPVIVGALIITYCVVRLVFSI